MSKDAQKTKSIKKDDSSTEEEIVETDLVALDGLDEDPDEDDVEEEELDPEVLEALNVKKKKSKVPSDPKVDYIPELERDFDVDEDF